MPQRCDDAERAGVADDGAAPPCLFCREPERIEIFEIWSGHDFILECCCEALHETVVSEINDDPDWARTLLRRLGVEELTGRRLRRVADDGCCGLVLDWKLTLGDVGFGVARRFIERNHARCGAPVTWRFGQGCWNGSTLIGIVSVGNPVARVLASQGALEVNRLCIRRDVPRALAWNCASMLYGWSAREAEQRGWQHIVTYTRADEDGGSLVAAGWTRQALVRGRSWHSGRRPRGNRNAFIDKVRWGKALHPRRAAQAPAKPKSERPGGKSEPANPWSDDSGSSAGNPFAFG